MHLDELHRVFAALRQACCQDNSHLGVQCRLRMMELVELRAMGWRPTLSHSQYYFDKNVQLERFLPSESGPPNHPNYAEPNGRCSTSDSDFTCEQSPASTNQHIQHGLDGPPTFSLSSPFLTMPYNYPPSGYFIIPAMGGWIGPQMNAGVGSLAYGDGNSAIRYVSGSSTNGKSNKLLREEMVILNADSGKGQCGMCVLTDKSTIHFSMIFISVMGVKGRRVAMVEVMSGAAISFQKVDPSSRERVLTITAPDVESLEMAMRLVEETIRRNESPTRDNNSMQNNQRKDAVVKKGIRDNGRRWTIDSNQTEVITISIAPTHNKLAQHCPNTFHVFLQLQISQIRNGHSSSMEEKVENGLGGWLPRTTAAIDNIPAEAPK